jgi:PAS domain-containing protein
VTVASEWSSALRITPNGTARVHALGDVNGMSREVIETLPAAIYITDAEGRLTFYNEAAVALWGYRPELGESKFFSAGRVGLGDLRKQSGKQRKAAFRCRQIQFRDEVLQRDGKPYSGIVKTNFIAKCCKEAGLVAKDGRCVAGGGSNSLSWLTASGGALVETYFPQVGDGISL